MKILTLEDYQKAGETFWPKYWYIAKELGEDAKTEDILKVMECRWCCIETYLMLKKVHSDLTKRKLMMIKIELSKDVAVDVARLLIREQEQYSTNEDIVPERIKHIREAIDQIAEKVRDDTTDLLITFIGFSLSLWSTV